MLLIHLEDNKTVEICMPEDKARAMLLAFLNGKHVGLVLRKENGTTEHIEKEQINNIQLRRG
jgi:hypothetical protein